MAKSATPFIVLAFLGFSLLTATAQPQAAQNGPTDPKQAAREAENKEIEAAVQKGPADIALRDEATLHLPAGNVFIPAKQASILMKRMGNFTNDHFLGLVLPAGEKQDWFVDVSRDDSGYVKDDEGKSIDADDLLEKLKAATADDNDQRRIQGMKEVELVGWVEKPHYDQASHHLIWSMELRDKGGAANGPTGVNYNTYALGRHGYITMDLVTPSDKVAANKQYVQALLAGLTFKPGSKYTDFNASTDKVAEYGLMALIGGVAIKKLGLLALASAFILKSIKLIVAGLVAAWIAFKKFVLGRKDEPVAANARGFADPPAPEVAAPSAPPPPDSTPPSQG